MNKKISIKAVFSCIVITTGLLVASAPSYSETAAERSEDRQEARDTRQTGRSEAHDTKAECKSGDEKNRSECRQEKRGTKQDARETAHDIKRH